MPTLLKHMPTLYRLTADLVVVVHFAFVAFVVFGLLLTLVGGVRRWEWVRGVRFRAIHVAAIGFVVAESLCGVTCPLTVWEQRLRDLARQASYRGDFIATWVHDLLFFDVEPSAFTLFYCSFGAAVVLTWILVPPRLRRIDSLGARAMPRRQPATTSEIAAPAKIVVTAAEVSPAEISAAEIGPAEVVAAAVGRARFEPAVIVR